MLTLSHGNTYNITYNIRNLDGSIKPLDGSLAIKYKLAKRVSSTPLIEFTLSDAQLEITDSANGKLVLQLYPEHLNSLRDGIHYHELWQENAVGEKTTLMAEKLEIQERLIKS